MTEVERILDQFRRAFEGNAWHGPALLELLGGVSSADAAARPIPSAHSIWELVLHIAAWKSACKRVNESRLDAPILENMSSVYITLQGVVQHDLYHAGQIAILKKALERP